ncbi:MAG TPA: methylated-DNA--[protein]-cysteine S-methyltransferase [Thermoplasmata archaeon]|nr:methylated-DNA--[protein]-cysteine S-methyltransferase [Thermoplasmata archaeon]
MDLQRCLLDLVAQIPPGRVTTYGTLAKALGDPRASRWVGRALANNPQPVRIPCHRVVHANGELGGYRWGPERKIALLRREGITIEGGKIVEMKDVLWEDFQTDRPLLQLRATQQRLRERLVLQDQTEVDTVGGVDVAYSDGEAVAACVVLSSDLEVLERRTKKSAVAFPYISTYLSFRESPLIEKVISELEEKPTALMVDGNGVLHPRGVGLASHVGVLLDMPTIGVAKRLLCGSLTSIAGEPGTWEIRYEGAVVGYALQTTGKPIYISPGHLVSLHAALSTVKRFCKRRIPEPILQAHQLATSTLRYGKGG